MKKVVVVLMQQLFLWYFQLCLKVQNLLESFVIDLSWNLGLKFKAEI